MNIKESTLKKAESIFGSLVAQLAGIKSDLQNCENRIKQLPYRIQDRYIKYELFLAKKSLNMIFHCTKQYKHDYQANIKQETQSFINHLLSLQRSVNRLRIHIHTIILKLHVYTHIQLDDEVQRQLQNLIRLHKNVCIRLRDVDKRMISMISKLDFHRQYEVSTGC